MVQMSAVFREFQTGIGPTVDLAVIPLTIHAEPFVLRVTYT
jgi:hypothetical protein